MLIKLAQDLSQYNQDAYQLMRSHRERPWSYDLFLQTISKAKVLFALQDQALVGYAIFTFVSDEAELEDICVHHNFRNQGIAQALIQQMITSAQLEQMAYILLEVNIKNTAAISLYTKNGFSQIGKRKNYYHHVDDTYSDALIMQKML